MGTFDVRKRLYGATATLSLSAVLSLSLLAAAPGYALAEETGSASDEQPQSVSAVVDTTSTDLSITLDTTPSDDTTTLGETPSEESTQEVSTAGSSQESPDTSEVTADTPAPNGDSSSASTTGDPAANPSDTPSPKPSESQDVTLPAKVAAAPTEPTAEFDDPSDTVKTGWGTLDDGRACYYGADGKPVTGWQTWEDGTRSYFDADGAAVSGLVADGAKRYYIDPSTLRTVRWVQRVDDKVYYFNGDYSMFTGWLTWNADKTRSYFGSDGIALSGWQDIDGKRYYFDHDNWEHGLRWAHTVLGKYYYFDGSCAMQTGWVTWNSDKTRSYFGSDGAAVSGWKDDGPKRFYLSPSTHRSVRWTQTVDGKYYYFDGSCAMQKGWVTWNSDKTRSYFGSDGAALSGWQTVGGRRYYFDSKNSYHGLRWVQTLDGKMYYFDSDCHMWTGWLTWVADKSRSYFGADGAAVSGWKDDGAKRYYISPSTLHTVRWLQTIDGKEYYFDGDYTMHTGVVTYNQTGVVKLYGSDGVWVTVDGFSKVGGYTYYVRNTAPVRWVQTIESKEYYFDGNYRMYTGWLFFSATKKWAYYGTDGAKCAGKLGWITAPDGKTYYFYSGVGDPTSWNKYVYLAWQKIQNMTSKTNYLGAVDQDHTYATFFIRQNGIWAPCNAWTVSVGKKTAPTPKGKFTVWYHSSHQYFTDTQSKKKTTYSVWYWTNWGPQGQGFHSVLCAKNTKRVVWSGLGQHNSGGCVRCPLEKALWTNQHIGNGTTIYSF